VNARTMIPAACAATEEQQQHPSGDRNIGKCCCVGTVATCVPDEHSSQDQCILMRGGLAVRTSPTESAQRCLLEQVCTSGCTLCDKSRPFVDGDDVRRFVDLQAAKTCEMLRKGCIAC